MRLLGLLCMLLAVSSHAAGDSPARTSAERIQALRSEIHRHDQLYHRDASPEITDAEYDELKRELIELEAGETAGASAIPRIPSESNTDDRVDVFSTHAHGERMLSLEKAHSDRDLSRFHRRMIRLLGSEPVYVIEH